jgi:ribosome-associated translation inhibitor RaiA
VEKALQLTFRNLDRSPALEADIRQHADKLEQFYDGIIGCRVVIEERHKHHRHGNHYHVRLEVSVPGGNLVMNREPDERHDHGDAYVAIRDAFDGVRRQLEDYARRHDQRGKAHDTTAAP